jgi:multicomponent Na+:H+ antiporter subunit G
MFQEVTQYIAGALLVIGSVFTVLAAVGILRLPDLYTRMHAASKAGAMGSGLMLIGIAVASTDGSVALRAIAGFVFILLTTPVSAHLLARAAYLAGCRPTPLTAIDDLKDSDQVKQ